MDPTLVDISFQYPNGTTAYRNSVKGGLKDCFPQLIHDDTMVCELLGDKGQREQRLILNWEPSDDWKLVSSSFDATALSTNMALMNVLLTCFVLLIFMSAALVLNRDAEKLIVEPIERMTKVTQRLANTLFSLSPEEAEDIEGHEAVFVEEVVAKMARFFDVKKQKTTTIYTPKDVVWNIEVARETRDDSSSGLGQRVTTSMLHNVRRQSLQEIDPPTQEELLALKEGRSVRAHKNSDKKMGLDQAYIAENNLFNCLIRDPVAIRYLRGFLRKVSSPPHFSMS